MENKIHFLSSCCQICRKENATITCEICHMISYCSEKHRKDGWFNHSTMCRAIYKVCQQRGNTNLYECALEKTAGEFRKLRHAIATECSQFLKRSLSSTELEMLYWPRICGDCFKFSPNLECCEGCAFEYACKGCQFKKNHKTWCSTIKLFREIVLFLERYDIPPLPILKIPSDFSSMDGLLDLASPPSEIVKALWSEVLTYPLTVYNSLLSTPFSKNVTLHIVGAELDAEVLPWTKWEHFFLHLLPNDHQVTLIFVGPDLYPLNSLSSVGEINVCQTCMNEGKRLQYEFVCNKFYHDFNFINKKNSKVTMITALNAGLYRAFGHGNSDSWKKTLEKLFAPGGAPVLITEYTCHEIKQDLKLIQARFPRVDVVKNAQINRFASIKPSLNVISDDEIPVIFKNFYYLLINPPSS